MRSRGVREYTSRATDVVIGTTNEANTQPATKGLRPKFSNSTEKIGMKPKRSFSSVAQRTPNDVNISIPHRPKISEGIAAARSNMATRTR